MLEFLTEDVVVVGGIKVFSDWEKLITALMSGETITLIDGTSKGICASTQGGQRRSVQESTTNVSIRGSKEAFNDSIETNTAMVRE